MKDRLLQFLAAEQLSPAHFADMLGVQRSGVSHILSGRNKPGFDFIEKLLKRFPAINADWLITGRGKMYKEMQTPPLFSVEPEEKEPVNSQPLNIPATGDLFSNPLPENTPGQEQVIEKAIATNPLSAKKIERIIILYEDKSFSDYRPAQIP